MQHNNNRPKWMDKESTRKRSTTQEKRIAKDIGGRTYVNSGAKYAQNDVHNNEIDVECKTTNKKQYILKREELDKAKRRTQSDKIPVFVIEFDNSDSSKQYAVIEYETLLELLNK